MPWHFSCSESSYQRTSLARSRWEWSSNVVSIYKDCYDYEKTQQSPESVIQQTMVNCCIVFLKERAKGFNDSLIKSFCNAVGVGVKHLWFNIEDKRSMGAELASKFFSDPNDIPLIKIGLLLNNLIIQNLLLNSSGYGYFKYRSMIMKFMEEILFTMFETTKTIFLGISSLILINQQASPQHIELLNLSLQNIFQTLTYPFCLSYSEFTTEVNLEEISTTFLPDIWEPLVIDLNMLEQMLALTGRPEVSMANRLYIMKIFSRVSSVKMTVIKSDSKTDNYIKFMLLLPNRILPNMNIQEKGFLEDSLDLYLRFTSIAGLRKLVTFPEEFEIWMNCFLIILTQVFKTCYQLEDKLFVTVNSFFKKITYHYSGVEYDFSAKLLQAFQIYMTTNFGQGAQLNIFKEASFSKYEKFIKTIEGRFEYFKDFYNSNKSACFSLVEGAMNKVMDELTELGGILATNPPKPGPDGRINQQTVNQVELIISRFCHILVIVGVSVVQHDYYRTYRSFGVSGYPYQDGQSIVDNQNEETKMESALLAKSFVCVSRINVFTPFLGVRSS